MRSISHQLNVGVIGSLLVVGIAISQTAIWLFDSSIREFMADSLRDEARSLLKAIERGPDGLTLDSLRIDPAYHRPLSGRYFVTSMNGQHWRSRSVWDEPLAIPDIQGVASHLMEGPDNQRLLWLGAKYSRYGQDINILVATDYSAILRDFRSISYLILAVWITALVLLAVLQRSLMRRALRPLDTARHQVEQLRTGSRSSLSEDVPVELDPLVREINHLLQHTHQLLKRSRNALGNLSHSLKTPLAVLNNLIEHEPITNDRKLYDSLSAQIKVMQKRITRELAHARTAGTRQTGNLFNIEEDITLLLETLRQAHQQAIHIKSNIFLHGLLPWEREDILELLGNLLDNACKWAQEKVTLVMNRENDCLVIEVSDDGCGIAYDSIGQAVRRGERLDEDAEGHGLGLAIVNDKVDAYDGTLKLSQGQAGGLQVRILLPWPS